MAITPNSVSRESWVYTEIVLLDADRQLRPTHVCGSEIRFAEAPHLTSEQVTIITRNGDRQTTYLARVLEHPKDARHIPIELLNKKAETKAPSRLTA